MPLEINSIGPPPEKHADRVVAEMMRLLAKRQAGLWHTIVEVIAESSDGSPRSQRKMEERVKRAGALRTYLFPGKRGKYQLHIYDISGWDQSRDAEITIGDPIPEKPWIAVNLTAIESKGGGRRRLQHKTASFLFITHHAMSRAAQRHGLRTSDHLLNAVKAIFSAALRLMHKKDQKAFDDVPPDGWRVRITPDDDAIVVLKRHPTLR